jgi:hypothetical protein
VVVNSIRRKPALIDAGQASGIKIAVPAKSGAAAHLLGCRPAKTVFFTELLV